MTGAVRVCCPSAAAVETAGRAVMAGPDPAVVPVWRERRAGPVGVVAMVVRGVGCSGLVGRAVWAVRPVMVGRAGVDRQGRPVLRRDRRVGQVLVVVMVVPVESAGPVVVLVRGGSCCCSTPTAPRVSAVMAAAAAAAARVGPEVLGLWVCRAAMP